MPSEGGAIRCGHQCLLDGSSGSASDREGKERADRGGDVDGLATLSGAIVLVRKGQVKVTTVKLVHRWYPAKTPREGHSCQKSVRIRSICSGAREGKRTESRNGFCMMTLSSSIEAISG